MFHIHRQGPPRFREAKGGVLTQLGLTLGKLHENEFKEQGGCDRRESMPGPAETKGQAGRVGGLERGDTQVPLVHQLPFAKEK